MRLFDNRTSTTARTLTLALAFALFSNRLLLRLGVNADAAHAQGVLHRRSYFYVGGSYKHSSTTTNDAGASAVSTGQMYVEHLVPASSVAPRTLPMVIIPGNGMTGTNFLTTPDGRPGWADYFMRQGFELYIIDQVSRGRSPWQQAIDGPQTIFDTLFTQQRFTATQDYNLWPMARLHTQWPGNGSKGDLSFDNFYRSIVPALVSNLESSEKMVEAGIALLDRIGPAILLTHSQSGQYGWSLADARPRLVKAIVALEPIGPPFINAVFPPLTPARPFGLTEIPITYSPPITSPADLHTVAVASTTNFTCIQQAAPARKLLNVAEARVLVVTSEAGYHAVYDACSVDYLRAAGVEVDHVMLGDVGIRGNGHMMFMEMNGEVIADQVVNEWLKRNIA